MKPKFSIAIPAYNRSDYLNQAVKSCLTQTAHNFEVIVSDDCSADDLRAVAESFHDPRVKYSRSEHRLGAAKNHQRAVALSQGQYVVNLHSDDILLPDYLEAAGRALDDCVEAAAVYSSMTYLTGSKVCGYTAVPKIRFADRLVYQDNLWLEKHHDVAPTCCMFRRDKFEHIGGYRVSLRFAYDYDLYMRFMTAGGGVYFLPQVLAIYRKHEEQAAQRAAHEALYDVLDLWQIEEYSHWPSWEIADLVLTELIKTVRSRSGRLDLLRQIRRNGVGWRLLGGGGEAVLRRIYRRMVSRGSDADGNYQAPVNLDRALRAATLLVDH